MATIFDPALRRLASDQRGTGAIELAMVGPVLALLTVGLVDLTQGISRRMELHDAVHRTLEKVAVGNFNVPIASGVINGAALKADAAEAAGVSASEVTVDGWLECDGVRQPSYTGSCPAPSGADPACASGTAPPSVKCTAITARYVRIRIDTTYSPTFGKVVSAKPDGTVDLFAEAAVRVQ